MIHRALQKMRLMVARGVVNLINDAGGLQTLQIDGLDGETRDDVERAQNFGLSSHPPKGSVPIMVAVGGSRDHLVAVAVDSEQHRPKGLNEGESVMYNAHGVRFLFDSEGNATLTANKLILNVTEVESNADKTTDAGDHHVGGKLSSPNAIEDGHHHTEHDGYTTSGPLE